MNLKEKLNAIQTEMNCPKNQRNNFGNYNYRSCEDILEGIKPFLKKYKVVLTISDDIEMVGNRVYVKAEATLHDCESDDYITNRAYARESEDKKGMDSSQITGATSSYARKYCLNGLFALDDNKDADDEKSAMNENKPKAESKQKVKMAKEQYELLKPFLDNQQWFNWFRINFGINTIEDIDVEKATAILQMLRENGKIK